MNNWTDNNYWQLLSKIHQVRSENTEVSLTKQEWETIQAALTMAYFFTEGVKNRQQVILTELALAINNQVIKVTELEQIIDEYKTKQRNNHD